MLQYVDSAPVGAAGGRAFRLGDSATGVVWGTGDGAPRPLVLLGHGGGQSTQAPGVRGRAETLARAGYAVAALDAPGHGGRPRTEELERRIGRMRDAQGSPDFGDAVADLNASVAREAVPEWRLLLDALEAQGVFGAAGAGYWGYSLGAAVGFPLVAAEPRIRAAVIGLIGEAVAESAAAIRVPVQFLMQWDDALVPRASALRLFGAVGSAQKTLHANPGSHGDVPDHEEESAVAFFARHLGTAAS